jgi:hypothetical protein
MLLPYFLKEIKSYMLFLDGFAANIQTLGKMLRLGRLLLLLTGFCGLFFRVPITWPP